MSCLRDFACILTKHELRLYNLFIICAGVSTKGNVALKATVGICLSGANHMGNGLAIAFRVFRHKGNDITRLKRGRILYSLYNNDVSGVKMNVHIGIVLRRTHRVGSYNVKPYAKQVTVVSVKGGNREDREHHHKYSKGYQQSCDYLHYDIQNLIIF